MNIPDNYYIGRSGRFNVKSAFSNIVKSRVVYKVKADSLISELLRNDIDVFATIYNIVGLSKDIFEADVKTDVRILTLVDSSGATIYIPDNMIIGGCIRDGVEYVEKTLLINLGVFPLNKDMEPIANDIKDMITGRLGVVPKYEVINSSNVQMISNEEDRSINKNRAIEKKDTLTEELNKYKEEVKVLKKTISDLECIIKKYKIA